MVSATLRAVRLGPGRGLRCSARRLHPDVTPAARRDRLGARRTDGRPRLPAAIGLSLGCAPPDDLETPDGSRKQGVDLALGSVTGEPAALDPELLAQVHVDDLIGALQVQHDTVWAGAAAEDLLEGRHLLRRRLGRNIKMYHLVAHPALVAGVVERKDLVGDDFRDLAALIVLAGSAARVDLATDDHDIVRE